MKDITNPDDPRHGTYAGARAHKRANHPICEPCREARNNHDRARRKAANPDSTGRSGALTLLEKAAREDVDWVVVDRVVNHQRPCPANTAERLQIIREWTAKGRPVYDLESFAGFNVTRYIRALREQETQEAA